MPYIPDNDRYKECFSTNFETTLNRFQIGELLGNACRNGGDLQYILAVAINQYIKNTGLRYEHCEEIMGSLIGALGEFQRKVYFPYEARKELENGGVYTVMEEYRKKYDY